MNAWNRWYGDGVKVEYHVWGVEENIDSDFVDYIRISEDNGNVLTAIYDAEEEALIVVYNGNRIWFYTPAPAFTYLHVVESYETIEELVTAVKHEISYILASLLS